MAGYEYRARDPYDEWHESVHGRVDAPDIQTALDEAQEDIDKRIVKISRVNDHV